MRWIDWSFLVGCAEHPRWSGESNSGSIRADIGNGLGIVAALERLTIVTLLAQVVRAFFGCLGINQGRTFYRAQFSTGGVALVHLGFGQRHIARGGTNVGGPPLVQQWILLAVAPAITNADIPVWTLGGQIDVGRINLRANRDVFTGYIHGLVSIGIVLKVANISPRERVICVNGHKPDESIELIIRICVSTYADNLCPKT